MASWQVMLCAEYCLGGCVSDRFGRADEMGLGKTVQVLGRAHMCRKDLDKKCES